MPDTGVRLQLMIGPTKPLPAPYEVVEALVSLEVSNNDTGRDGFQMSFTLGKDNLRDYGLLLQRYFEPPARVVIAVLMKALPFPQVLIDGIITNHQIAPSDKPGSSTLVVTGEDISLKLDLDEDDHRYENLSDSAIVSAILKRYVVACGLIPVVTETTYVPNANERVTTFQGTHLAFIQHLAERNSFVFYIEPTNKPGSNTAYWGPPIRIGGEQPALSLNMGPETNVESLSFSFNALGPATPRASIFEPIAKIPIPVPVPSSGLRARLALRPAVSLRTTRPRDTANKDASQAALEALSAANETADAVTGNGQLDVMRYGRILRARELVGVRGVGHSYSGLYYVQQVSHNIKPGEYKQSFSLTREGHGAIRPLVRI